MWGIGVMSLSEVIFIPAEERVRTAISLPVPGPFKNTLTVFNPHSIARLTASSATACATKGVPFRDPLKPKTPDEDQHIT